MAGWQSPYKKNNDFDWPSTAVGYLDLIQIHIFNLLLLLTYCTRLFGNTNKWLYLSVYLLINWKSSNLHFTYIFGEYSDIDALSIRLSHNCVKPGSHDWCTLPDKYMSSADTCHGSFSENNCIYYEYLINRLLFSSDFYQLTSFPHKSQVRHCHENDQKIDYYRL